MVIGVFLCLWEVTGQGFDPWFLLFLQNIFFIYIYLFATCLNNTNNQLLQNYFYWKALNKLVQAQKCNSGGFEPS